MNFRRNTAMSTTVSMAVIIVVIIIAAAGWGAYAGFPRMQTTTATTTTTIGGSGSVSTVTASGTTVTTTATVTNNASSNPVYLQPATCTTNFNVAVFVSPPQTRVFDLLTQYNIGKEYAPTATFQSFAAGGDIATAMVGGTAQMGYQGDPVFVPDIIKGAGIKLVSDVSSHELLWQIFTQPNGPFTTLASLHGQTIAVSKIGSAGYYYLIYALNKTMGWQINTDYKVSALGSNPAQFAAVEQGTVAASVNSYLTDLPFLQNSSIVSLYDFTAPGPNNGVWANTPFIQQHPECVQAVVNAFAAAALLWDQNSTIAISILENDAHMTPQVAQIAYGAFTFSSSGAMSITSHQKAVNFLYGVGQIPNNISATTYIQPGFAPIIY